MNIKKRNSFLIHHGVEGMEWGKRRYQNKDGSLTPLGRERYRNDDGSLNDAGQKINTVNYEAGNIAARLKRVKSGFDTADRAYDSDERSLKKMYDDYYTSINNNVSRLNSIYEDRIKTLQLDTIPAAGVSMMRDKSSSLTDMSADYLVGMGHDVRNAIETAIDKCNQRPINSKEVSDLIETAVRALDDITDYTREYDDYEYTPKSHHFGGSL